MFSVKKHNFPQPFNNVKTIFAGDGSARGSPCLCLTNFKPDWRPICIRIRRSISVT